MKATFTMTFDGREVEVSCTICPPEYDVGILGPYAEEICAVYLDDDTFVPDVFLEKALDRINDKITDIYYDQGDYDE